MRRLGAAQLRPREIIREILYPLTDMVVALALIVFILLEMLAEAAGVLGLWLAIAILPAYSRYLLSLLAARANGRDAPTPGIELFTLVGSFWSLFPLVLLCFVIVGAYFLNRNLSFAAALVPGVFVLFLFPASMAVLAVTRSPVESLNPLALMRVVHNCGRDYLLVPLAMIAISFLISYLAYLDAPNLLIKAAAMYASFLMFTLTGKVLHANAVAIPIDMPPQREPDAEQLDAELTRDRTKALNHAYGFVSRGNRAGGLQHLYRWIENEIDIDAAYRWFFVQMLKWESTDAALFLAQTYLTRLLLEQRDVEALKLMGRCLLENKRFKPLPEDMVAALAAAERQGNDDLIKHLKE